MSSGVYFKAYVDAFSSGMVADMGPERWQTLCALASFMDEAGECYPSQELLAARLGVSRQAANKRINRLLNYYWKGERIVQAEKRRSEENQQWANTVYCVLPGSMLSKFDAT